MSDADRPAGVHGRAPCPAAQRERRQAARSVDEFLMGFSDLPR
jgi:hypothetical protein